MDNDTINDLKQFIAATVSQQTSTLRDEVKEDVGQILKNEIRTIVQEEFAKLESKMDEGFAGVGDALETLAQTTESKTDDHEARITKLESQAA